MARSFPDTRMVVIAGLGSGVLAAIPLFGSVFLVAAIGCVVLTLLVDALKLGELARSVWLWTLAGLLVHLVLGIVLWQFPHPFKDDALYYNQSALSIVSHWQHGSALPNFLPGKMYFLYIVAGVYRVLGPHAEVMLAVNAVLAAALIPLLADTTKRMFGSAAARCSSALVLLLPGVLLWSSMLLREAMALVLIAVAANAGVRMVEGVKIGRLVALGLSLVGLLGLRSVAALAVGAGIIVGVAVGWSRLGLRARLAMGAVLLVTLSLAIVGGDGSKMLSDGLGRVDASRAIAGTLATSAIDPGQDVSTPGRAALFVVSHAPEAFAGPFPWNMRSARHVIALLDVAVWWCLLPTLFVGLHLGVSRVGARAAVLLLPAGAMHVVLTLAVGDFGTMLRQRPQVVLFLVPFLALALSLRTGTAAPVDGRLAVSASPGRAY